MPSARLGSASAVVEQTSCTRTVAHDSGRAREDGPFGSDDDALPLRQSCDDWDVNSPREEPAGGVGMNTAARRGESASAATHHGRVCSRRDGDASTIEEDPCGSVTDSLCSDVSSVSNPPNSSTSKDLGIKEHLPEAHSAVAGSVAGSFGVAVHSPPQQDPGTLPDPAVVRNPSRPTATRA